MQIILTNTLFLRSCLWEYKNGIRCENLEQLSFADERGYKCVPRCDGARIHGAYRKPVQPHKPESKNISVLLCISH